MFFKTISVSVLLVCDNATEAPANLRRGQRSPGGRLALELRQPPGDQHRLTRSLLKPLIIPNTEFIIY